MVARIGLAGAKPANIYFREWREWKNFTQQELADRNAKNNMGAYVGYHPFMGHWLDQTGQFLLVGMSNDKKEVEIILTECSNYGIKF